MAHQLFDPYSIHGSGMGAENPLTDLERFEERCKKVYDFRALVSIATFRAYEKLIREQKTEEMQRRVKRDE